MRIAFDLDGVLADLHGPFAKTALRLFPELDTAAIGSPEVGASPPDTDAEAESSSEPVAPVIPALTNLPVTERQANAVWSSLTAVEDFWSTLDEIESGSIKRLAALADERRWEILFITSRPWASGRTVQRQSQQWLERLGFPLPSVYVVHGSRGRIADALNLDVVVDDRPENCLDVALESKAAAILVWRGTKEAVPASARRFGIAVVPSVAACLEALVEVEQSDQRGSLLDRLRRLFGLRTARPKAF
jgi:hypothetical protein